MQTGIKKLIAKKHVIEIEGETIELTRPKAKVVAEYMARMAKSAEGENEQNADSLTKQLDLVSEGVLLIIPELQELENGNEIAYDLLVRSGGLRGDLAGKMLDLFGIGKDMRAEAENMAIGPLGS